MGTEPATMMSPSKNDEMKIAAFECKGVITYARGARSWPRRACREDAASTAHKRDLRRVRHFTWREYLHVFPKAPDPCPGRWLAAAVWAHRATIMKPSLHPFG